MSSTPDQVAAELAVRLEEARRSAEGGDLGRAAAIYQEVLGLGDIPQRARAALGLAVALEGDGDVAGARAADRIAIATKDPEYGARAAYHLALSYDRAGERARAMETWHLLVDFGNPAYTPPAMLALAQLSAEDGDAEGAGEWWEQAIAVGDGEYAPAAAHDYGLWLLDLGEARRAQEVLAHGLGMVDRQASPQAYDRLLVNLGIAHLEQAIAAFAATGAGADPAGADIDNEVEALAIELLARTLPLRGREEAGTEVWRRGLTDPRLGDAVRARLQRALDVRSWSALFGEPPH